MRLCSFLSVIFALKERLSLLIYARKECWLIAMKGLAGGLIHNSKAAMAYISKYDNVLPIWGIQKMSELEEWLKFMDEEPVLNDKISEYIEKERKELVGDFLRMVIVCHVLKEYKLTIVQECLLCFVGLLQKHG